MKLTKQYIIKLIKEQMDSGNWDDPSNYEHVSYNEPERDRQDNEFSNIGIELKKEINSFDWSNDDGINPTDYEELLHIMQWLTDKLYFISERRKAN